MSEYIYKVLWLDDDFEAVSDKTNIDENHTRKTFQEDVEMAGDYGIQVVGVSNYEMFCEEVKNLPSFQAVIFDLKGMEREKTVSNYVMPDALDILRKNKELPVFIYSANITSERFEIPIRNIQSEGRCFSKAMGVTPLYEKIIEVLDANLHYYQGHEECLLLFEKQYLKSTNRENMDAILKNHEKMYLPKGPYNNMRDILEDMTDTLVEVELIKEPLKKKLGPKIKYLADKTNPKRDINGNIIKKADGKPEPDYENPVVPFSVCPIEIKYTLKYLDDMANRYSHFLETHPDYLRQGETIYEYNVMIQQSVYPAFFVVMKWFYSYMERHFASVHLP